MRYAAEPREPRSDCSTQLHAAAPGRVAVYGIENADGTPVYVHAKVCVVDDEWATVGSDNFNRRSWTHDSELTAAVVAPGASPAACGTSSPASTSTPRADVALEDHFEAYAASAEALAAWHRAPGAAPRPPGRLRPLDSPEQGRLTAAVGRSALPPRLRPGRPTAGPAAATDLLTGNHRPTRGGARRRVGACASRGTRPGTTRHTASSRATPAAR